MVIVYKTNETYDGYFDIYINGKFDKTVDDKGKTFDEFIENMQTVDFSECVGNPVADIESKLNIDNVTNAKRMVCPHYNRLDNSCREYRIYAPDCSNCKWQTDW